MHTSPAGSVEQATAQGARRPGLVTFAAVILLVEAGFSAVWALVTFAQPEWLIRAYSTYGIPAQSGAWVWGVLDLLVGAIALFAGVGVLRGAAFAQLIGYYIAGISAIRWFFFLQVVPVTAALIIALDVLVIYGLAAHSKYFSATFDTEPVPVLGATQEDPFT